MDYSNNAFWINAAYPVIITAITPEGPTIGIDETYIQQLIEDDGVPTLTWSGAGIRIDGNTQTITNDSSTEITFDLTPVFDSDGYFDSANNQIVVPDDGYYCVTANAFWNSLASDANSLLRLTITLNGAVLAQDDKLYNNNASGSLSHSISYSGTMNAGVALKLLAYQKNTSAGSVAVNGWTAENACVFTITKIASVAIGPSDSYDMELLSEVVI